MHRHRHPGNAVRAVSTASRFFFFGHDDRLPEPHPPNRPASAKCCAAPTRRRVPSCPDWTAADLLWHLVGVQLFWGTIVRDRLDDPAAPSAESRSVRPTTPTCSSSTRTPRSARRAGETLPTTSRSGRGTGPHSRLHPPPAGARGTHPPPRRRADRRRGHRLRSRSRGRRRDEALRVMFGGRPPGPLGAGRADRSACGRPTPTPMAVPARHLSGTARTAARSTPTSSLTAQRLRATPSFTVNGSARDLDACLWNRPSATWRSSVDADYQRSPLISRRASSSRLAARGRRAARRRSRPSASSSIAALTNHASNALGGR